MTVSYDELFERNRAWVESKKRGDPDYFTRLAVEQHPDFLFIGCADSRVPANEILALEPGDMFVHRNIANLVTNTDLNVQSVIHFAVEHLEVRHVIVCGHYGCGGIRAAMQQADLGILNPWLREIRDVCRLHRGELAALDDEARYRRMVELNVQEQCVNVIKTASVQKAYLKRGHPTVHGWVYDLSEGLLRDLDIQFDSELDEIRELYRLDIEPNG